MVRVHLYSLNVSFGSSVGDLVVFFLLEDRVLGQFEASQGLQTTDCILPCKF